MAVATAIAIYFLIWWIVLFAVLPWGVRAQGEESPPGTDPGAPRVPQAHGQADLDDGGRRRGLGASCALIYVKGWVTLDGLAALLGFPQ